MTTTGAYAQLRSYTRNKFRTFHPWYRKFEFIPLRQPVSDPLSESLAKPRGQNNQTD